MKSIQFQGRTRLIFGAGVLDRLGEVARELEVSRTLLVADPGLVSTGYVHRATRILTGSGIEVVGFHDFDSNPDSEMVEAGRRAAAEGRVDAFVALGGGSSLDCAKGINFILTSGSPIQQYVGYGKATQPMLPMIAVPTTAGTGSEAQSYALISDAETHAKLACGDDKAAFRVALLDPALTVTQPRLVTATSGCDAMSHAVESYVTTKGHDASRTIAREAWRLLAGNFERVLSAPADLEARGAMLLGAHYAGLAIEQSMLGAAHACANPLTARYGTTHGVAIAVMLPHVVRWNGSVVGDLYAELLAASGIVPGVQPAETLAAHLEALRAQSDLPATLRDVGVDRTELPRLAENAAKQWTGTFNPRPFDAAGALELYERAY